MASDPQGRRPAGMANIPVVKGNPRIPVLTLHNLGDLFVPFKMEIDYAQRVAANGVSDLVVQRAIRGVGHCDFTAQELISAFDDLVRWVEQGVKPAGDVILDATAVAAAGYGCAFTEGSHALGVPCP